MTLAVHSPAAFRALELPARLGPFVPSRGGDIVITVEPRAVPPVAASDLLFDSGGTWRVYRQGGGLLYVFRPPMGNGPPARGLLIDIRRTRGRLFLAASEPARPPGFALSYPLEELLFAHHLAHAGGIVVHACGVAVGRGGVVFCGRSGAGKTMTARLWRRRAAARILSDDRLVLRRTRSGWRAFGTPWHGSGRFASPGSFPITALVFLEKGQASRLRPLSVTDAASRLFARSFPPPWEAEGTARVLETATNVAADLPAFLLRFRPDRTAVDTVLRELFSGPR